MTRRNIIALGSGFLLLAAGTTAGFIGLSSQRNPLRAALWSVFTITFFLASFELFHFTLPSPRRRYIFGSRGFRGVVTDLGWISLAIGMTLTSFGYQLPSEPPCGGGPGAGFPVAFICDAKGDSPISDWGRMSWHDVPNPLGILVDFLFYAAVLWMISFIAVRASKQLRTLHKHDTQS